MPSVIVAGGGLAGLAAAAALGGAGYDVDVYESRPFLGGRATSYPVPNSDGTTEVIDNCQHVLLRCCVNLLDFYDRLGVVDLIQFHREFYFVEPGGRTSTLAAGSLPAPLHFLEAFLKASYLSLAEKLSLGRALMALRREYKTRPGLDQITMLDWLKEKKQPQKAIDRFWGQVLISAVNEDLDRMAAIHGFQVFWLGFLARSNSYEMGIPSVPLGELYGLDAWKRFPNVRINLRSPITRMNAAGVEVNGQTRSADYYICALPAERLESSGCEIHGISLDHSPITGIHLWFDRCVTNLPHATLLDRTIQWMFNKGGGKQIQLVVSASRSLVPMRRDEVLQLAVAELAEFFPLVRPANLVKAHVVKEVYATFSARPGLQQARPPAATRDHNFFVAGDWTRSGWPATMEGAVRSGYIAAEGVTASAGHPLQFVLPDIA